MTCKVLYLPQLFPCSQRDIVNIEQMIQCGWEPQDIMILHACPHLESMYCDIMQQGIYEIMIPQPANTKPFWEEAWKHLPQYIPPNTRYITLSWFDDQYGYFTKDMYHQIQSYPIGRLDTPPNVVRHIMRTSS